MPDTGTRLPPPLLTSCSITASDVLVRLPKGARPFRSTSSLALRTVDPVLLSLVGFDTPDELAVARASR